MEALRTAKLAFDEVRACCVFVSRGSSTLLRHSPFPPLRSFRPPSFSDPTTTPPFWQGLIAEPDFQRVRDAFVAAQQIRTGIEGGLLREEEVQDLRERFIDLLHHNMGSRRSDGGQTAAAHSR